MFNFQSPPPLSLYVHLPWCERKCPYCDFNSFEVKGAFDEHLYVDALLIDLEQELPLIWGRRLESVFIGGGTPSLFSVTAITRLMNGLRALLPALIPDTEVTLEANPGSAEQEKFRGYHDAGINRLSIGVQSFDDAMLKVLGRVHNSKEATKAVESARLAGFDNLNLDLMFALPGQSLKSAINDIETALAFQPEHLSYYQLTIEPNTFFHSHPPVIPNDDSAWDIETAGHQHLLDANYQHYEVSAFCQPKRESRHNLNYWQFGDYIGIGAGAHGKISLPREKRILRRWKVKQPKEYMQKAGSEQRIGGESFLNSDDIQLEFALNAFRLQKGFDAELFSANTGCPADDFNAKLKAAEEKGFVQCKNNKILPTEQGKRFLNDLVALFNAD
ncbi:MAG: oxygen-independent coproporphyrinogen III oxidase-like protein [Gammaproteobacteria bacterium]|nr:oxygen-independent coproporphyrinogen III oxidase-like protein [Gammaproteobacteria bacterium]